MATELYWAKGPWPGKLAMSPRPRGGEWLEDEISCWHRQGVDTVVSMLTPPEEQDLNLVNEAPTVLTQGLHFHSLPVLDRQTPDSLGPFITVLDRLNAELAAGRNLVIHCRQGVGRAGLLAACLLIANGIAPDAAMRQLTAVRGVPVPETQQQRDWIDRFANPEHCLKTRPEGTMLDGHHRIEILRQRGENVNALPREVIERQSGLR